MHWNESFARRKNSKFVSLSGPALIGSLFSGASIRYHVVLMPLRVEHIALFSEGMCLLGLPGSFVVLAPSGVEDMETLFGMDVKEEKPS
jgi:hypothetical protein